MSGFEPNPPNCLEIAIPGLEMTIGASGTSVGSPIPLTGKNRTPGAIPDYQSHECIALLVGSSNCTCNVRKAFSVAFSCQRSERTST
jgi:hypothetical protein